MPQTSAYFIKEKIYLAHTDITRMIVLQNAIIPKNKLIDDIDYIFNIVG